MLNGFHLDPHDVLGVAPGASIQEVRDAYHAKSKKHHPDLGGDEWAFRVVVRAFEILCEAPPDGAATARHDFAPEPEPAHRPGPTVVDPEQARPGARDRVADPARTVAVELLRVRYEARDPMSLTTSAGHEDPNLSGSLNLNWPDPELAATADLAEKADEILGALARICARVRVETAVVDAKSEFDADGRTFACWLTYAGGEAAWQAFRVLRDYLKRDGLGVRQWTRDLVIPRAEGK